MIEKEEKPRESSISRRTFSGLLVFTSGVVTGLANTIKTSSEVVGRKNILDSADLLLSSRKYQSFTAELKKQGFQLFSHKLNGQKVEDTFAANGEVVRRMGFSGSIWVKQGSKKAIKVVSPFGVTSGGTIGDFDPKLFGYTSRKQAFDEFFKKEKEAYRRLAAIGSSHIPFDIKFNDDFRSIEMEYLGEDFCAKNNRLKAESLSQYDLDQIVQMFEEYRKAGIFKQNTFSSNLFRRSNGDIVATDFKMWTTREEKHLEHQIRMVFYNLGALHNELPMRLKRTFSDFPKEKVDALFAKYDQLLNDPSKEIV